MVRFATGILLAFALGAQGREIAIFDTDSGLFGDDGAALVMLLRSPAQAAIRGIVVTPGNVWPEQGAEYTFHILELLKRSQVPVFTGAERPLMNSAAMALEAGKRWGALSYTGAFSLDPKAVYSAPRAPLTNRKPRRESAVEFLIAEIERHPGELTILAVGPMTNIALALRLKPEVETEIKQIVFMGGNIRVAGNASPAAEFNFWFDPEAARIVLRSRIPRR
jgi:inosine-uridine nucleoside N-ribohydrolase